MHQNKKTISILYQYKMAFYQHTDWLNEWPSITNDGITHEGFNFLYSSEN